MIKQYENPLCEYPYDDEDAVYLYRDIASIMERGPSEFDIQLRVDANETPASKTTMLLDLMIDFFDRISPGKAYETNALGDALGPDPVTAQRIKTLLANSTKNKYLAPHVTKGSNFVAYGKTRQRNVWSSLEIAEARRAGDVSAPVVKGIKKQDQKPPKPDYSKDLPDTVHLAAPETVQREGSSMGKSWGDIAKSAAEDLIEMRNQMRTEILAELAAKETPTIEEAFALLELGGYTIVPPSSLGKHCHVKVEYSDGSKPSWELDNVQGVDNSNISRHPMPGAARVDCGQCGGTGKVYMKQEQE